MVLNILKYKVFSNWKVLLSFYETDIIAFNYVGIFTKHLSLKNLFCYSRMSH